MVDLNKQHHGHIVVGLRAEASSGDSTCSQLAEDAADYIELLEYHLRCDSIWKTRIEKLEAALARIAKYDTQAIAMDALRPGERIREKKDD